MRRLLQYLTLPLLSKELAEQSSRPRTYLLRVGYGALFYGIVLWRFVQVLEGSDGDGRQVFGSGRLLFDQVFWLQFAAIYALVPPLTAGVLTAEKERDTLGLLLITKLGPWTIVLEKLLGRLLPMLMYLLMALPLMSVAYSLGGVEARQVLLTGVAMVFAVLQIGSLAILCSVWFRTTAQALLATYVLLAVQFVASQSPLGTSAVRLVLFDAPAGHVHLATVVAGSPWMLVHAPGLLSPMALPALALLTAQILFQLTLARALLWRRAFLKSQNWVLALLRRIDDFFRRINQNRVTRGIVLIDERTELPDFHPIAWRETRKRALGTLRYLVRFLLIIEVPVVLVLLLPLMSYDAWTSLQNPQMAYAELAVWWIGIFAVLIHSTGLVAGERARQTLDALLASPLTANEIVEEKFAGVRRLIRTLWVPLGTVLVFRVWWVLSITRPDSLADYLLRPLQTAVGMAIYLPLVGWLGWHAGLRGKTQLRALLASLGVVLAATGLPWLLIDSLGGSQSNDALALLSSLSPATLEWSLDHTSWTSTGGEILFRRILSYILLVVHFGVYGGVSAWLRWRAPRDLSRETQRLEFDVDALPEPATL